MATPKQEDDEETRSFLHNNVQHHSRSNHKTAIILTLVNALMLLLAAIFFGIWYHNQHFVRNADLRRTSSYSKYSLQRHIEFNAGLEYS